MPRTVFAIYPLKSVTVPVGRQTAVKINRLAVKRATQANTLSLVRYFPLLSDNTMYQLYRIRQRWIIFQNWIIFAKGIKNIPITGKKAP